MKEINQAYLTGNAFVDKYIIENPKVFLHELIDIHEDKGSYAIFWHNFLQENLTNQEFQAYMDHHYPKGYVDFLNQLAKDATSYEDFYTAVQNSNEWYLEQTAMELTETLIEKEVWLDQITDYYLSGKHPFEYEETLRMLDCLIDARENETILADLKSRKIEELIDCRDALLKEYHKI